MKKKGKENKERRKGTGYIYVPKAVRPDCGALAESKNEDHRLVFQKITVHTFPITGRTVWPRMDFMEIDASGVMDPNAQDGARSLEEKRE